mgnify:CR=1 FL=1
MQDVEGTPAKKPLVKTVREEIKKLKKEFEQNKMSEYIDVFRDSYAMLKEAYWFSKYTDPVLLKKMRK